jgi:hypothetical protein
MHRKNTKRPEADQSAFKMLMHTAIAEAIKMEKSEDFERLIENKNTLVLTRCNKLALRNAENEE